MLLYGCILSIWDCITLDILWWESKHPNNICRIHTIVQNWNSTIGFKFNHLVTEELQDWPLFDCEIDFIINGRNIMFRIEMGDAFTLDKDSNHAWWLINYQIIESLIADPSNKKLRPLLETLRPDFQSHHKTIHLWSQKHPSVVIMQAQFWTMWHAMPEEYQLNRY